MLLPLPRSAAKSRVNIVSRLTIQACAAAMYSARRAARICSIGSPAAMRRRISELLTSMAGISISRGCLFAAHSGCKSRKIRFGLAGAAHDQRRGQAKDLGRLLPVRHVAHGVGADQEEEFGLGQFVVNLPQRVDRVAEAAAVDFERADAPVDSGSRTTRLAELGFDRQVEHFDALGVGGVRAAVLERLDGRRREPDFIERSLLVARTGERQVAVVHGIEAAAENAETHGELGARGLGARELAEHRRRIR